MSVDSHEPIDTYETTCAIRGRNRQHNEPLGLSWLEIALCRTDTYNYIRTATELE